MSRENESIITRAVFEGLKTIGATAIFCGSTFIMGQIGLRITEPAFIKNNQEKAQQAATAAATQARRNTTELITCAPGTQDLRCYSRSGP